MEDAFRIIAASVLLVGIVWFKFFFLSNPFRRKSGDKG